jgi:hypothetical protein
VFSCLTTFIFLAPRLCGVFDVSKALILVYQYRLPCMILVHVNEERAYLGCSRPRGEKHAERLT